MALVPVPLVAQASPQWPSYSADGRAANGLVGHVGRWFADSRGRVLIFHGGDTDAAAPIDPVADPSYMENLGFDSTKVYVSWANVEPQPGVYDTGFLHQLLVTQQALWQHGIYTEFDIQGGGAAWTNVTTGYATVPGGGGTTVHDPTGVLSNGIFLVYNQQQQDFYDNAPGPDGVGIQTWFDRMCTYFGAYFRGTPGVFGYGIVNEAVPGSEDQVQSDSPLGDPHYDVDELAPFYEKAIAAFRQADPKTLVHVEPDANYDLDYSASWLPRLGDPNLVFDYHSYVDVTSAPDSDAPLGSSRAQEAQIEADRNHAPAFNAERFFSVEGLDQLDRAMQGWNYFEYTTVGSPTENPLDHLDACPQAAGRGADGGQGGWAGCFARPYPQAVAGTPTGWSFDSVKGTFTLTYSTRQPNGAIGTAPTQVFVPKMVYTNGYVLSLQGARVVGRGLQGQLLSLDAIPGATTVTVVINPTPSALRPG